MAPPTTVGRVLESRDFEGPAVIVGRAGGGELGIGCSFEELEQRTQATVEDGTGIGG